MTIVGEAFVTIRPDFSRFERELKKQLSNIDPDLSRFESKLNKALSGVKPDTSNIQSRINRSINQTTIETSGFESSLNRSLNGIDPNTSGLERKLNRSLNGAQPDVTNFSRSLNRSLRSMDVDASTLERRLQDSLNAATPNTSGLERNLNRAIAGVSPDTVSFVQRIENAFDSVGDSTDKLERRTRILGQTLTRLGVGTGLLALVSQASALTGALLPVTGLLAAIPGLAASAAAGVGTLFLGFSGIGDALKESFKDVSGGAAAAAVDTTSLQRSVEAASRGITAAQRDVERALRDVGDANYGVEQASRALLAVQKDAIDAELALADARDRATESLAAYQDQLRGATLSQERAELALLEARQRLIDITKKGVKEQFFETYLTETEDTRKELAELTKKEISDSLDVRRAKLDVEEAEFRLQQAIKDGISLQEDANKAINAGVEGNADVISAKDRVAEATERIAESNRGLLLAQRDVADANQGVIDSQEQVVLANQQLQDAIAALARAQENQAGASSKAADALAKLSPNARKAVEAIIGLKDEYDDLKNSVQDRLFAGLDVEIERVANASLPTLEKGLGGIADSFNRVFKSASDAISSPFFQERAAIVFEGTAKSIDNIGKSIEPLTLGLANLAAVAQPFIDTFTTDIGKALTKFGLFLQSEKGTKKMRDALDKAYKVAGQLFRIAVNLGTALKNVFGAADNGKFLASLEAITAKFAEFTGSAEGQEKLKEFFENISRAAEAVGEAIPVVIDVVSRLFDAFASLPGPVQEGITSFLALSLILGPVITGMASLSVAAKGLIGLFELVALGPIKAVQALGDVAARSKAVKEAAEASREALKKNTDEIARLNQQLDRASRKVGTAVDTKSAQNEVDKLKTKIDELKDKTVKIKTETDSKSTLENLGKNAAGGFIGGFLGQIATRFAPLVLPVLAGAAALLANPIFWAAIAVAAVGFLVFTFRDELYNFFTVTLPAFYEEQKPKVLQFFKDLPGNIGEALGDLTGTLISKAADLMRGFDDGKRIAWEGEDGKGGIKGFFTNLGDSIYTAVGDLNAKIYERGKEIIVGFFKGVGFEWDQKKTFWENLGENIKKLITSPDTILLDTGKIIIRGLFKGFKEALDVKDDLIELSYKAFTTVTGLFSGAIEWLYEAGKDFIKGFFKGIREQLNTDDGKKVVEEVVNLLPGGIIGKLKISSPSKVTERLGMFTAQGYLIGLQSLNKDIANAATEMAGMVTQGLNSVASPELTLGAGGLGAIRTSGAALALSGQGSVVQKSYNLTLSADYTTVETPEENFRRMELLSLPYDLSGV